MDNIGHSGLIISSRPHYSLNYSSYVNFCWWTIMNLWHIFRMHLTPLQAYGTTTSSDLARTTRSPMVGQWSCTSLPNCMIHMIMHAESWTEILQHARHSALSEKGFPVTMRFSLCVHVLWPSRTLYTQAPCMRLQTSTWPWGRKYYPMRKCRWNYL